MWENRREMLVWENIRGKKDHTLVLGSVWTENHSKEETKECCSQEEKQNRWKYERKLSMQRGQRARPFQRLIKGCLLQLSVIIKNASWDKSSRIDRVQIPSLANFSGYSLKRLSMQLSYLHSSFRFFDLFPSLRFFFFFTFHSNPQKIEIKNCKFSFPFDLFWELHWIGNVFFPKALECIDKIVCSFLRSQQFNFV